VKNKKQETWEDYNLLLKTPMEKFMLVYMLVMFLVGFGFGTNLVNKPILIAGMPILWLWWLFWLGVYIIGTYILNFKMMGMDTHFSEAEELGVKKKAV
jgi:hypothetical protein